MPFFRQPNREEAPTVTEVQEGVLPPSPTFPTRKSKAILIAVSDGFSGYGDFLFALKLSEQLRKEYADRGTEIPPIYLVSQPSGRATIERLSGDTEFGVTVLTPDELQTAVDTKEIDVGTVIEGPVFNRELITRIDDSLATVGNNIPLIMIAEYGYNSPTAREYMALLRTYRKSACKHLAYSSTFYSGFQQASDETGILLSEGLRHPASSEVLVGQLDEKIRASLSASDSVGTQASTELSMQYSHDKYSLGDLRTPAAHFLNIHREFCKTSGKSQDVLMVGKYESFKIEALRSIRDKLISDGYSHISYYNADTKHDDVLYDSAVPGGRSYRVIYTRDMSHTSMIACNALSGPLIGATGDQSLGEALSGNKLMVYECLAHKKSLIENYDTAMQAISLNDPDVVETLRLLRDVEISDKHYEELGERLRNPVIQEKLQRFNKDVLKQYDFATHIFEAVEPVLTQHEKIVIFLKEGRQKEAADLLLKYRNKISVTDIFNGKTLLQNAIDYNPKGYFVKLPHLIEITRLIRAGDQQQALDIMLANERLISPTDQFERKSLSSHALENNPDGAFNRYNTMLMVVMLLNNNSTIFDSHRSALTILTDNGMSLFDEFKGKTFWQYAIENNPDGTIAKHFSQLLQAGNATPTDVLKYLAVLKNLELTNHDLFLKVAGNPSTEALYAAQASPPETASQEAFAATEATIEESSEILFAKMILEGKRPETDSIILRTSTGFYKLNPTAIGKGGWGSVYSAQHYSLDDGHVIVSPPLAIKQMRGTQAAIILDKEQLLFQEAHSDKFFERFTNGGKEYLAMPLFSGVPLDSYLLSSDELGLKERQGMAIELLIDLTRIHERDVIHHDIKPKNILFEPLTKKMHILDFGCAEETGTPIKYKGIDTAKYAIEYMPPEYVTGTYTSTANDIYSMTLSLAEMLGINKKNLVQARMEQALATIDDERFKVAMRTSFAEEETLDETLFSEKMGRYTNTPVFERFVRNYTSGQYDFSPFQEQLGEETISLLNRMQTNDPTARPSAQECLLLLKHAMLAEQGKPISYWKEKIDDLRPADDKDPPTPTPT